MTIKFEDELHRYKIYCRDHDRKEETVHTDSLLINFMNTIEDIASNITDINIELARIREELECSE